MNSQTKRAIRWWFYSHLHVSFHRQSGYSPYSFYLRVSLLWFFVFIGYKLRPWRIYADDRLDSEIFIGYLPWHVEEGGLIKGKTLWHKTSTITNVSGSSYNPVDLDC